MEGERGDEIDDLDLQSRLKELLPQGIDNLEDSERRRAYRLAALQFETFVLEILRSTVESAGPAEQRAAQFSSHRGFDFLSEISIRDLPPPIAFEIKYLRSGEQMVAAARELFQAAAAVSETHMRTLVFVTNREPTARDRGEFRNNRDMHDEGLRYEWWGPKELQSLLERLEGKGRILDTLHIAGFRAALRDVSRGTTDSWKATRATILSELRESWRDDQLVLFLGAGVSIEAGVPLWGNLLATLYGRLLDKFPMLLSASPADFAGAVESLLSLQGNSPLMSARMLRSGFDDGFNDEVRAALYASVEVLPKPRQLAEIARLCDPPRGRVGARAVVTYNFDDLLEQHLDALNVRYLSIATDNSRAAWTQLPIYHVHGLIPQNGLIPSKQTLVFSEEGYHTAYNNPYAWSNVIQLNLMTQYKCFFVGLSMTDPNLRRLLEIASVAESGPRHVALLRRVASVDRAASAKTASPIVDSGVLAIHHKAWEVTMKELGVNVLWYEEFSEIPRILASIRE